MTRKPPVVVFLNSAPAPAIRRRLPAEQHDYAPKQKPNPLHVAAFWLGHRLEERAGGYFLDRVPASLDTIMRETNRVLAANGVELITSSERWAPRR